MPSTSRDDENINIKRQFYKPLSNLYSYRSVGVSICLSVLTVSLFIAYSATIAIQTVHTEWSGLNINLF